MVVTSQGTRAKAESRSLTVLSHSDEVVIITDIKHFLVWNVWQQQLWHGQQAWGTCDPCSLHCCCRAACIWQPHPSTAGPCWSPQLTLQPLKPSVPQPLNFPPTRCIAPSKLVISLAESRCTQIYVAVYHKKRKSPLAPEATYLPASIHPRCASLQKGQ